MFFIKLLGEVVIIEAFSSLSINVNIDGNTIVYPYNLGGTTILGATFEADDVTLQSASFSGFGSVLITQKK